MDINNIDKAENLISELKDIRELHDDCKLGAEITMKSNFDNGTTKFTFCTSSSTGYEPSKEIEISIDPSFLSKILQEEIKKRKEEIKKL